MQKNYDYNVAIKLFSDINLVFKGIIIQIWSNYWISKNEFL